MNRPDRSAHKPQVSSATNESTKPKDWLSWLISSVYLMPGFILPAIAETLIELCSHTDFNAWQQFAAGIGGLCIYGLTFWFWLNAISGLISKHHS
ncbi:Uncharacterised protein [Zhongshania aliphaticivorans]|nr:Uncharacterised protein [Zhongshania aliphaticivorans]